MLFIAIRFRSSSTLADLSNPSSTFLVIFIAINKSAIMTGKLSTAIRMLLLLALEAMPEIKLKEAEKPIEVKNKVRIKSPISVTGLPMKVEKSTYAARESTRHRSVL